MHAAKGCWVFCIQFKVKGVRSRVSVSLFDGSGSQFGSWLRKWLHLATVGRPPRGFDKAASEPISHRRDDNLQWIRGPVLRRYFSIFLSDHMATTAGLARIPGRYRRHASFRVQRL